MPLPMNVGPADLPGITRIAIGEITESRSGKPMPAKLDYIRICKGNPARSGKTAYIPDEDLTATLRERLVALGEPDPDKPQRIPVAVMGNLVEGADGSMQVPPQILQTELAMFAGGRRECHCGDFRLKTEAEALDDGLSWPIPDGDTAGYIGEASRKIYEMKQKEVTGKGGKKQVIDVPVTTAIETLPCNPSICPFSTGTHDRTKYAGRSLCKPRVKLALYLPWAPAVGPIAQFVSTSWHSARYLESTLLNIGGHTGGWLAFVPLWLNMGWSKVNTREGNVSISYLYFSTDGDANQLRLAAGEVQQEYRGSEDTYRQAAAGGVKLLEAANDQEPDLYPEQEQESIDERGRRLEGFAVETLGWSSAKFNAEWDATGGDVQAAVLLEKRMDGELVEKQREQRVAKVAEVQREASSAPIITRKKEGSPAETLANMMGLPHEAAEEPEPQEEPDDDTEAPEDEAEEAAEAEEQTLEGERGEAWAIADKDRVKAEALAQEIGWSPVEITSALAGCESAAELGALAKTMKAEKQALAEGDEQKGMELDE